MQSGWSGRIGDVEPRPLLTRHRSVLSFRALTGVLATVNLAACSLGPPPSSPVPMCSAANVYAHAGENGVAIPKNGTASLDTTVGSSVHLTASGDCAASVRFAAAREGSTAPPYVQVETFNPTKVGTTALKVLWVPCAPAANGPIGPACAPVEYGTLLVVAGP